MNRKIIIAMLLIGSSGIAFGETNYLCITDLVSGFHYDAERESWAHATFLPGEKFEVRELGSDLYRVTKIETQSPWTALCTRRTDQTDDSFSCENGTDQFHFNRKELRFASMRYFGFWNGSADSLSISIGKCALN